MIAWQTELEKLRENPYVPLAGIVLFSACLLWTFISCITVLVTRNPAPPTHAITASPIPLQQFHLFGMYNASLANLPNANIQFTLQGTVVVTGHPNKSEALIAGINQPTLVYHVGSVLQNNMTITRIDDDDVIIDNNGTLQKLSLPIQTVNPN